MTFQSILAVSSAGFAALYFLWGAYRDLGGSDKSAAGGCGKCSGGCPAARKA